MTTHRLQSAQTDLLRAKDMVSLGQAMSAMTQGKIDPSDLYRSAIVQAISALDHYFHGIVIDRAVDLILGRRASAAMGPGKIGLPFNAISEVLSAQNPIEREIAVRTHVANRMSRETLQQPDEIAQSLRMVGIEGIWSAAFGQSAAKIKKIELGLVVSRRNRIVHQADGDPLNPGSRTPIDASDAFNAIECVIDVLTTVDHHCS